MLLNPLSDCCQSPPFNGIDVNGYGQCGWCLVWLDKDEWIENKESDSEKAGLERTGRTEWSGLCERSHRAIRDFKNKNNN